MNPNTVASLVIRYTGVITDYSPRKWKVGTYLLLQATRELWVVQKLSKNAVHTWRFVAFLDNAQRSARTVATATSVADVTPAIAGQFDFDPVTFQGGVQLTLNALLQVSAGTVTLKLYNLTDGLYVDIGGVGVTTLTANTALPSKVVSVDLATGSVAGFPTNSAASYQLEIATDDPGHVGLLGLAEMVEALP